MMGFNAGLHAGIFLGFCLFLGWLYPRIRAWRRIRLSFDTRLQRASLLQALSDVALFFEIPCDLPTPSIPAFWKSPRFVSLHPLISLHLHSTIKELNFITQPDTCKLHICVVNLPLNLSEVEKNLEEALRVPCQVRK